MRAEPGGMETVERAIHLLRAQGGAVWLVQAMGALPLLLASLHFLLASASESPNAERGSAWAFLCAVCFLWFNVCRSRFAHHLLNSLAGEDRGSWKLAASPGRLALLSCKLFVLPLSLFAVVPWPACVAFFRTVPLVNGRPGLTRATRLAALWPRQNWAALGLALLLALVVFVNYFVLAAAFPQLVHSLTGVEDEFTRPVTSPINTVTFAIALALTWVTLDPLYQAIYAVRMFLGEARQTGADLRVALRRMAVIALLLLPLHVQAAPASKVTAPDLQRSIHLALDQPSYSWRLPTAPIAATRNPLAGVTRFVRNTLKSIGHGIRRFFDWLFPRRSENPVRDKDRSGAPAPGWTLLILFFVLAAIVGFAFVRFRFTRRAPVPAAPAAGAQATPDLASETVTASDLPEERWLDLARQCLTQGEYRAALRAFYLANLAYLARRELLTISRSKSNLDYSRELRRRARNPDLDRAFSANVRSFERGWYGLHPVAAAEIEEFESQFEQMRAHAG